MVHYIECKRFWCSNYVLLKKDKREFLTHVTDISTKFQIQKFLPLFPLKSLPLSTTNQHVSNCYQGSENLTNLSYLLQVTFNFTWMNKCTLKLQNGLHFTKYFPFYGKTVKGLCHIGESNHCIPCSLVSCSCQALNIQKHSLSFLCSFE